MKKNMKLAMIALLMMGSSAVFAGTDKKGTDPEAVVSFAGYKNAQPVYKMNIVNPSNEKLIIMIKDQYGTVLHEEVVKDTLITRQFVLNKQDIGTGSIQFEVNRYPDPVVIKVNNPAKEAK